MRAGPAANQQCQVAADLQQRLRTGMQTGKQTGAAPMDAPRAPPMAAPFITLFTQWLSIPMPMSA